MFFENSLLLLCTVKWKIFVSLEFVNCHLRPNPPLETIEPSCLTSKMVLDTKAPSKKDLRVSQKNKKILKFNFNRLVHMS